MKSRIDFKYHVVGVSLQGDVDKVRLAVSSQLLNLGDGFMGFIAVLFSTFFYI